MPSSIQPLPRHQQPLTVTDSSRSRPGKNPRRPLLSDPALFEGQSSSSEKSVAGELLAEALVRRSTQRNPDLIHRIVHLAEVEGLDALAELWAHAPAVSLSGTLWRLYLLREAVNADPQGTARAFADGQAHAPVATVIAGAVEPYGPDHMTSLLDTIMQGISTTDFADVLFRAAAFARVVAAGRAQEAETHATTLAISRFLDCANELESAARAELDGRLG